MPERSLEQVMESIDFLLDDFDAIARQAFATYREYDPAVLVEHDARAAAACTYCHMLADAERRFADKAGVILRDVRGQKVWIIGEAAVVRLKKMDEDGRVRNYPTVQARAFDRGDVLPGLPPEATRLSVGYLLDPTATEIRRVQIAKPLSRGVDWCVAIVPPADRESVGSRWTEVTRQRKF